MYITPRPLASDDPLFAARLAAATALAFGLALWLRPSMPMIAPALTAGLIAGMRGRFDAGKAIGGPITMALAMAVMAWLVQLLRPFPAVLVVVIGLIYTLSYTAILRTGNPLGMLVLVAASLMSIMGMNSVPGMLFLRDVFAEGAAVALCLIPLLYWLLPPATRQAAVQVYPPGRGGRFLLRGAIRGGVLLLLTGWLYTVVPESNMMLSMAAVFVMVFPSRAQRWAEARERIRATVLGGGMALLLLATLSLSAHAVNLVLLVALGGLLLGHRMVFGRQAPMVYQYALSAMVAIVGAALTAKAPLDTTVLRIVLTLGGAVSASLLTGLLESVVLRDARQPATLTPPVAQQA